MKAIEKPLGPPPTLTDIRQEVRLAVVMYGGVSLAIYINGVAQELFKLVRATAPSDPNQPSPPHIPDDKLVGTEKIYRQIGQMLGSDPHGDELPNPGDPIRTRFIVDIISGTSAGGINGIYLAKALANDQLLTPLEDLWIDEGDIEKLINDARSAADVGLEAPDPPRSLLNSQRMYCRLVEALDGMERDHASTPERKSPYVSELDLFVTTTDIRGLPIQLQLSDMRVPESRHRNVFQFRYSHGGVDPDRNDFVAENDPLLGFTARCTSAFPFAFEPMKLTDIDAVLERMHGRGKAVLEAKFNEWKEFFPAYLKAANGSGTNGAATVGPDIAKLAFGDGGYLDNKPFGYAIDALPAHRSSLRVERKLLYIEPSPEHPEEVAQQRRPPNVIENVDAALSLARAETIREDLQRVLARNRLVERVERILTGMEDDVPKMPPVQHRERAQFEEQDLLDMITLEGISYGAYHRLKVAATTDEIAAILVFLAQFDPESDVSFAVREVVRAWRELRYSAYREDGKATQNAFLARFDFAYPLRRLAFVLRKIDQLHCLDATAKALLAQRGYGSVPDTDEERSEFRDALTDVRRQLTHIYDGLRRYRDVLHSRDPANPLSRVPQTIRDEQGALLDVLAGPTPRDRATRAQTLVAKPLWTTAIDELAAALAAYVANHVAQSEADCRAVLERPSAPAASPKDRVAEVVRRYFDSYGRYDLVWYPIAYSTDIGEEIDRVDVIRISPEDAKSLIDERQPPRKRTKLAGTSVMHFGAFLDRGWRSNDILWGKLDGAERLITALLKDTDYEGRTKDLVEQAHLAILEAHFQGDGDTACQLVADAMAKIDMKDPSEMALHELALRKWLAAKQARAQSTQALQHVVQPDRGAAVSEMLQAAIRRSLDPKSLYEFFKNSYQVNRELNRESTLRTLGRATQVVGKMLDDLSQTYRVDRKPALWLTRAGQFFWGFVEVAVPGSLGKPIFAHWLKVLYAFEVAIIILGFVLGRALEQAGLVALGVTLLVNAGWWMLGDFMHHRGWWKRRPVTSD